MTQNQSGEYWESYYKAGLAPETPSLFAEYVMKNYASPNHSMIELGCGNGRDARFFAASGVGIVAVDQCATEIDLLAESRGEQQNPVYRTGDFTTLPDFDEGFDLVYSRFTLHSVSAEAQKRTLEWCYRNLKDGGKLCIETRGQKNELFEKGQPVSGEQDAYIFENHYRRFVDFDVFTEEITDLGFNIIEKAESTGFAPFGDTDYHFIRTIAEK